MAKKKFLGLQYPIVKTPRGLFAQKSGIDQIKADLLQLLLTNPGERCLTGDTKIPLADNTEFAIKELVGKEPFWVYSYNPEDDMIVPGLATAHATLKNADLVEVTLDNNEKIRCTPDHLWLLRNGEYCRADELIEGTSLMPLYRTLNTSKYERIYQPYLKDYRETHLCFVFGKRLSGVREVVHHKDLDKRNNSPDNLQWMTCQGHKDLHKEINNAFMKKFNEDPVFKQEWPQKQKAGLKKYYETHDGSRKGAKLTDETKQKLRKNKIEHYASEAGEATKKRIRQAALEQFKDSKPWMCGKNHTEETKQKMRKPHPAMSGDGNPSKRPDVREKLKKAWEKRRLKNHKVVAVKKLQEKEDCYDLSVEKYHNFALSAGVFVHNCMLPTFGTPLRKLIFEPNDSIIETEARAMIAKSIAAWEPRIIVNAIHVSRKISRDDLDLNDTLDEIDHILSIRIDIVDPENISKIEQIVLELPLGGANAITKLPNKRYPL